MEAGKGSGLLTEEYMPEKFQVLDYSRKDAWHACYAQDGGCNLTAWVPTVRLTCNGGARTSADGAVQVCEASRKFAE